MKETHGLFRYNGKIQKQNDSITMKAIRISIVRYSLGVVDRHISKGLFAYFSRDSAVLLHLDGHNFLNSFLLFDLRRWWKSGNGSLEYSNGSHAFW